MTVIASLYQFISWGVTAVIVAAILLIVLRSLFNYMDVNPFKWSPRTVRRVTDPVIMPVRRVLIAFRIDPKAAPFIAVILIIIAGYLAVQVAGSVLNTVAGIIFALTSGRLGMPVAIIGYVIFGFLGLYTLAIFIRIIFSWLQMGYANPLMRFLIRTTEPLMEPLRRIVPHVGMFDISPIVAFLILWLCQAAVAATLLQNWPVRFF
jgi:YggT family protein